MKRLRAGIFMVLLAALLLCGAPAYADTPDPDSTPTIESTNIYRNLLETGDILVVIYANIPYATTPDLPVTQTFIWRLISTDNVTEFGSTVGTSYNDDGYGYNVYSMYFSAANVTSLGIVWGTSYTTRLSGNPSAFDTTTDYNYTINAGQYSAETVSSVVQAELGNRVIAIAGDLDNKWGLTATTTLLTQTETATVLSTNGEAFFRGAIFALQSMAPSIFSLVIRAIDIEPREWPDEYSENLTGQWGGGWIDTAQAAGKAFFGTDYDLFSLIMLLIMGAGLLMGNVYLTGDAWNGMVDVAVLGVVGTRLGMLDMGLILLLAAGCIFFIGAKVWFGIIK